MKEFKFPLESLRVLRKQKERVAQQRYARALDACQQAEVMLQVAATELEIGRASLSQEIATGIAAGRLAGLRNWCLALEIRWRERQAALTETKRVAGLIFREMAAATREREGLDRYHEKAQQAYELESRRSEQKMFDEMAVQANGIGGFLQLAGDRNF
jgi:flagellar export protein FliJ